MTYPYSGPQYSEQKRLATLSKYYNENSFTSLSPMLELGQTVLELGSGSGQMGVRIIDAIGKEGHYVAIELHPERVKEARDCFGKRNNVVIIERDAIEAVKTLPKNTFDIIYFLWFLWVLSVEERTILLQTLFTLLKPGGKLIAEEADMLVLKCKPEHPAVKKYAELTELRSRKSGHPTQLGLTLKDLVAKIIPKFEHTSTQTYQPVISDAEDKEMLYHTVISFEKAFKDVGATEEDLEKLKVELLKIAQDSQYRIYVVGSIINFFKKPVRISTEIFR